MIMLNRMRWANFVLSQPFALARQLYCGVNSSTDWAMWRHGSSLWFQVCAPLDWQVTRVEVVQEGTNSRSEPAKTRFRRGQMAFTKELHPAMCGCKALIEDRFALGQRFGMCSRCVVAPKFTVLAGIDPFTLMKAGVLGNRNKRTFSPYLGNNCRLKIISMSEKYCCILLSHRWETMGGRCAGMCET